MLCIHLIQSKIHIEMEFVLYATVDKRYKNIVELSNSQGEIRNCELIKLPEQEMKRKIYLI